MLKQYTPNIIQAVVIAGIVTAHVKKTNKVSEAQLAGDISAKEANQKVLKSAAISVGAMFATLPVTLMACNYLAKKAASAAVEVVTEVI